MMTLLKKYIQQFSLLIAATLFHSLAFAACLDKPDKIRKLHKKPTPLLGGLMLFSTFLLINLYLIFLQDLKSSSLIIFASCFGCLNLVF